MDKLSTESIYNLGFDLWNSFMELAIMLFTTSPTSANSSVYSTVHNIYLSIRSCSVPIAICFFLIAVIKDNVEKDSGVIPRRLMQDVMKYLIFVAILANLWEIMGMIVAFTDGLTDRISASNSVLFTANEDLNSLFEEVNGLENTVDHSWAWTDMSGSIERIGAWILEFISIGFCKTMFFITGIAFLFSIIASGFSIISTAYQRILKPLIILPFSAIMVAFAAGSTEQERTTMQYLKTFFGFCLSGAFMVVAINIGTAFANGGLIAFDLTDKDLAYRMFSVCIEMSATPLVIAGLVKGIDSIIGRIL